MAGTNSGAGLLLPFTMHVADAEKGRQRPMAKPTHDRQLQLQIYDLRREAKLRQARDWFFQNCHVDTFEDAMRIAAPGTENGVLAMMVLSYFGAW
jgi:hypothetical protein